MPAKSKLRGFSIDSRTLQSGAIFMALKTEKRDGHAFLQKAQEKGAAAAFVQGVNPRIELPQLQVSDPLDALQTVANRYRRCFTGTVVGITGSCGKTSTKDLLKHLLGSATTHATFANYNNHLGVPLTLLGIDPHKHQRAIVEMGTNAPGEIAQLASRVEPDVSIVTVVGPVHLERLGSLENVAAEKAQLFPWTQSFAVFPASCLHYAPFREITLPSFVVTQLGDPDAKRPLSRESKRVTYTTEQKYGDTTVLKLTQAAAPERHFRVPRAGRGLLQNAALAIVTASTLGLSDTEIEQRIQHWLPSPLRGEIIGWGQARCYVDCYNANPLSLKEALQTFQHLFKASTPRLYVIGSMAELGTQASEFHFDIGRQISLHRHDHIFLIGEHAEAIQQGLIEARHSLEQITLDPPIEVMRTVLEQFKGAVLLKGSRAYELEKLLPSHAVSAAALDSIQ